MSIAAKPLRLRRATAEPSLSVPSSEVAPAPSRSTPSTRVAVEPGCSVSRFGLAAKGWRWGSSSGVVAETAVVAVAMLAGAAVVAALVALLGAGEMREALGFPFTGVPDRLGEAVSIFVANARLAAGVGVAAAVAQARLRGRVPGLVARVCDVGVLLALAVNVGIVGAATGAYGGRMVVSMLPHGPLELAAFSLAIAAWRRARAERLDARWAGAVAAGVVAILGAAALLETFAATT
jgi:hypothetical protein